MNLNKYADLSYRKQLFSIYLVILLSYIGLALPYSILPILFIGQKNSSSLAIYSFLISLYPIGQAMGMIIFGYWSDFVGRKKILLYSLLGTILTFIISGLCIASKNYIALIFVRLFCGFFEGNFGIALAAISDIKEENKLKTKIFGKANNAITCGFLLGPFLGSVISDNKILRIFNYATPFYVSAILSCLTFIFVVFFFKAEGKYLRQDNRKDKPTKIFNFLKDILRSLKKKGLNRLILQGLLITAAVDIFYQFVPVYLVAKWQSSPKFLGIAIAIISIGKILGNTFLLNTLNRLIKSNLASISIGLFLNIIYFYILISTHSIMLFLFTTFWVGTGIALTVTNNIALISSWTSKYKQGTIINLSMGLRILCSAIFCNLATLSCYISYKLPFLYAILFALLALVLTTNLLRVNIQKLKSRGIKNRYQGI